MTRLFHQIVTDSTNICDLEPIGQKNRMQIYVLSHETCQLQKSCHVIEATINHAVQEATNTLHLDHPGSSQALYCSASSEAPVVQPEFLHGSSSLH